MAEEKWYASKTKVGVVVLAIGTLLTALANSLSTGEWNSFIDTAWKTVGGAYGVLGVRGWFKK